MPLFQHPVIRVVIGGGDPFPLPAAWNTVQAGQAVRSGRTGEGGSGESGKGLAHRRVHGLGIGWITGRGRRVGVEGS